MSDVAKKPWSTPKLVVLAKMTQEESVLMKCSTFQQLGCDPVDDLTDS